MRPPITRKRPKISSDIDVVALIKAELIRPDEVYFIQTDKHVLIFIMSYIHTRLLRATAIAPVAPQKLK